MSVETTPLASRARHWTGQLVQVAAIVGLVFLGKGALAEPFYVPSASMEPTLLIGDALLASKFPYGYSAASMPIHIDVPETGRIFGATPKRGDVVVFRWPGDRAQVWVKRVIGLPGDRIQVREGQVWINGTPARVKADGIGEAEDDNGGSEPAHRYIETLPGGVAHPIFKLYDSGRLDNTPATIPPTAGFRSVRAASACCRSTIWWDGSTPSSAPGISACAAARSPAGSPVFASRDSSPACTKEFVVAGSKREARLRTWPVLET
jgi:signal peptidase I